MSVFVVSDYHINCLVNWARGKRIHFHLTRDDHAGLDAVQQPESIGELLKRANGHRFNTRYHEDGSGPSYHFKPDRAAERFDPLVIVKACHCLQYPCLEFAEWEGSPAERILHCIEAYAIRELPGYSDADGWELAEPEGWVAQMAEYNAATQAAGMVGGQNHDPDAAHE